MEKPIVSKVKPVAQELIAETSIEENIQVSYIGENADI
jgi:hypothetical protein